MDSEEARQRLERAITDMAQARRQADDDPAGVVTTWVVVTAERYAVDGGWGSTVRVVPAADQPDWQTAGLLHAGQRLQDESWQSYGSGSGGIG